MGQEKRINLRVSSSQMYDTDGSGFISRDELAAMLRVHPSVTCPGPNAPPLQHNSDKLILFLYLQALPEIHLPPNISEPGKLDEIFDQMDTNNDGRVSLEEFRNAMEGNSNLRQAVLFPLQQ